MEVLGVREYIDKYHDGRVYVAAMELGLTTPTLYNYLKENDGVGIVVNHKLYRQVKTLPTKRRNREKR